MSKSTVENINTDQVFPKKLSYLALILSFFVIISQIFIIAKNISDFEKMSSVEIPVLEMSAINIRLNGSIYHSFELLINAKKDQRKMYVQQIETYRDALMFNLDSFDSAIEQLDFHIKLVPSRSILTAMENEVLALLNNNEISKAKKILRSTEFQNLFFSFSEKSQDVTEKLAITREKSIKNKHQRLIILAFVTASAFILIVFLWVKIYVGYSKNIISRKELENNLEEQRAVAFNTAKLASLGEMSAGIAHEINNPLTIITGSATRLRAKLKRLEVNDPMVTKHIEMINETIFRIASIVKSMRTISRDGVNDELSKLQIEELYNDSLVLLSDKIRNAEVVMKISTSPEAQEIMGRATEISQVVINLVGNAIDSLVDANIEYKEIILSSELIGNRVVMKVTDNGPGIPQDSADKIFDPFYTTKDVGKGTGLGLSLSRRLVESHSGNLSLEQSPNKVSFVISFDQIKNEELIDKAA